MSASLALDATGIAAAQGRIRRALIAEVALGSTGYIAAVTIGTLVAEDLLGSTTFAGVPSATVVLGASAGSILLSSLMARRGRRPGLVLGYAVAVVGALLAATAVVVRSFPLLILATMAIGWGNSANQLSRYAAADMVPPAKRAGAISIVVWASTVGAVIGPSLVAPAGTIAASLGLPQLAGPYLVPVVMVTLSAILSFVLLRPDPMTLAHQAVTGPDAGEAASLREIFRRPIVIAAVVALIAGQCTMTLVMTMTPLHMTQHGGDLTAVGLVLSAHTFGMFALSPISGRLVGRLGTLSTIFLGTAVLVTSSLMAAFAPPTGGLVLGLALFLLGFGWNLGFVAGSALLSSGLEIVERTRVQGAADALIWVTAAIASFGSGLVVGVAGYTTLGLLGAGLVAVAVWFLVLRRPTVLAALAPAAAAPLLDPLEAEA